VVGVLIVGASSYVRNTYTNGNPLFPLYGKGSVNFIPANEPVGYEQMPYLKRFLHANLAPTSQVNRELELIQGPPRPKIPFTVSPSEIATLSDIDTRQAGYGVWFGGILIVSTIAGAYLLVRFGRQYRQYLPLLLLPLVSIGICVLAIDATWWARYLPQLAIFPIIVVIALYLRRETVLPNVLIFAILFNVILTASVGLDAQSKFQQETGQSFARHLPCDSKQPTRVYSSIGLDGAIYNVRDKCHNIRPITTQEFNTVPQKNRIELYLGLYAIPGKNVTN